MNVHTIRHNVEQKKQAEITKPFWFSFTYAGVWISSTVVYEIHWQNDCREHQHDFNWRHRSIWISLQVVFCEMFQKFSLPLFTIQISLIVRSSLSFAMLCSKKVQFTVESTSVRVFFPRKTLKHSWTSFAANWLTWTKEISRGTRQDICFYRRCFQSARYFLASAISGEEKKVCDSKFSNCSRSLQHV